MSTTRIAICLFDESIKEFNKLELIVGSKLQSVPTINPDGYAIELFIREAEPSLPEWVNNVSNFGALGPFNLKTSSSGAILFLKTGKRILGCCFGSSVANINKNNIETDFGLGVAFDKMRPDQTKSIQSWTLADNPQTNTRSTTLPTNRLNFNVDRFLENITELAGFYSQDKRRTLIKGKEFFSTLAPDSLKEIIELCESSLNSYLRAIKNENFKALTSVRRIKDNKTIKSLDVNLCKAITKKSSSLYVVDFEPVENIDGYKLSEKGEQLSEINTANVLGKLGSYTEIKVEYLKSRHIYPLDTNGQALSTWLLYKCIFYTDSLTKSILYKGKWYDIDDAYLQTLKNFIDEFESTDSLLPAWNGKDDEDAYNKKAASKISGQCWDKLLYSSDQFRYQIEFCDILHQNNIIHVKKYSRSSLSSHLLMQTTVSAQLLATDHKIKPWILKTMQDNFSDQHLIMPDLSFTSAETIYYIVLLCNRKGPLSKILPFFSLISFNVAIKNILQLGYTVKIAKV
jgi:uncharacterized protein (TIGR04141 family)